MVRITLKLPPPPFDGDLMGLAEVVVEINLLRISAIWMPINDPIASRNRV